ncbi:hypothetical protein SAMD00019534_098640, partial [Acytostelium subglobosum LB1]|uniref:hypothetical protein n=1 Tax=Acytostelium subglobosum LB1 TaxID=1410327 RepID=UPI000644D440
MYTPRTAQMDAEDVSLLNPFFYTGSDLSSPTTMDIWNDNTSYVPPNTMTEQQHNFKTSIASPSMTTRTLGLSNPPTPSSSRPSRLYDNQQGLKNLLFMEDDDDELDLKTKYYIKPFNHNQTKSQQHQQTPSRLFTHTPTTLSTEDSKQQGNGGSRAGFTSILSRHPMEQGSPLFDSPPLKPNKTTSSLSSPLSTTTTSTYNKHNRYATSGTSPNPSSHSSPSMAHSPSSVNTKSAGNSSPTFGKAIQQEEEDNDHFSYEDDQIRELTTNDNDYFVCQACGMQQYHQVHHHHHHQPQQQHHELDSNPNSESHSTPPTFNVIELLIQQWSKISQRVSMVALNETGGGRGSVGRPTTRSGMSFFVRLSILPFLLSAFVPFTFCVVCFLIVLSALSLSTLAAFVFLLLTTPFFIVGIVGFLYVATFIINGSIVGGHRTVIVLGVSLFELLIKSVHSTIIYLANMYKGINNGRSLRHR